MGRNTTRQVKITFVPRPVVKLAQKKGIMAATIARPMGETLRGKQKEKDVRMSNIIAAKGACALPLANALYSPD